MTDIKKIILERDFAHIAGEIVMAELSSHHLCGCLVIAKIKG